MVVDEDEIENVLGVELGVADVCASATASTFAGDWDLAFC